MLYTIVPSFCCTLIPARTITTLPRQTVTTSAEIMAYAQYGDKWSFEGDHYSTV